VASKSSRRRWTEEKPREQGDKGTEKIGQIQEEEEKMRERETRGGDERGMRRGEFCGPNGQWDGGEKKEGSRERIDCQCQA